MPPKYGGATGWQQGPAPVKSFTPPPNKFAGYTPHKTRADEEKEAKAPAGASAAANAAPEEDWAAKMNAQAKAKRAAATQPTSQPTTTATTYRSTPTPTAAPTPAPTVAKAAASSGPAKSASASKKRGIVTFSGKRHEVLNFKKGCDPETDAPIMVKVNAHDETVYIDGCQGTGAGPVVIKIEGKFNALTINNCQRCGIVFDDGIAVCEIVNSKKLQVQVTGLMNNWSIDKSSEITLFISEQSTENMHILSSQWEAVNVVVPMGEDFKEFGFPEQVKTSYSVTKKAMVHEVFEAAVSESM